MIKKYFMVGFAFLLPLLLTFFIVRFLITLLTDPFLIPIQQVFYSLHLFEPSFLLNDSVLLTLMSQLFILLMIFGGIVFIGMLGRLFLIHSILNLGEHVFYRIPVVNRVYQICQEAVKTCFSSKDSFSHVVFVPYPTSSQLSLGLITHLVPIKISEIGPQEMIPVFIPAAPNPSVGFMLQFKKSEIIFVAMKVEEAMKFVVSCGAVS